MLAVRSSVLLAMCVLVSLTVFSTAASADGELSVEDAVKESRATGKPILTVKGTDS